MIRQIIITLISLLICMFGCKDKESKDEIRMPVYGINVHIPSSDLYEKIKELNPPIVRMDLPWARIEAEKDKYNFDGIDQFVDFCYENKIQILGILTETPEWAIAKRTDIFKNIEDWETFVHTVTDRYKDKIQYYEIWNEPNLDRFFSGSMYDYYNKILVPASNIIKAIDINIKIVAPSISVMTTGDSRWDLWLEEAVKYQQYFDIVSCHIYKALATEVIFKIETGTPFIGGSSRSIKELLNKFTNKIAWITEVGFKSNEFGEEHQKLAIQALYNHIESSSTIDRIFIYELIDDSNINSRWGILNSDKTNKPAYEYLKSL